MRVLVVIATLGQRAALARVLESLAVQDPAPTEVIVACQGDEAPARRAAAACALPVRVVAARPGAARARNAGVAAASCDWDVVAFPDDDTWNDPDAFARMAASIPEGGALVGTVVPTSGRPRWRVAAGVRPLDRRTVWTHAMEAGMFVTRAAWSRVGPLDESLGVGADGPWQSGEGTDWLLRALDAAVPVIHDPTVVLREEPAEPADLAAAARRARAYARGTGRVFRTRYRAPGRLGLLCRSLGKLALAAGSRRGRVLAATVLIGRLEGLGLPSPGRLLGALRRRTDLARLWLRAAGAAAGVGREPAVLLLGAPYHANLGDQAQTWCAQRLLADLWPGRRVVTFDTRSLSLKGWLLLRLLGRRARDDDVVVLHSGYHTTDRYPIENQLGNSAARLFVRQRIVMLPQTVWFADPAQQRLTARVLAAHPRLTMLCRDPLSLATARTMLPGDRTALFPDLVAGLIGARAWDRPRGGVLLVLRADGESTLSPSRRRALRAALGRIGEVRQTDTTIAMGAARLARRRGEVLERFWTDLAGLQVVVTDRFHGLIFSLIAGTPVVVLPTADHKLTSGVDWFDRPEFHGWVRLVADPDEAADQAAALLAERPCGSPPDLLRREHFDRLADLLGLDAGASGREAGVRDG